MQYCVEGTNPLSRTCLACMILPTFVYSVTVQKMLCCHAFSFSLQVFLVYTIYIMYTKPSLHDVFSLATHHGCMLLSLCHLHVLALTLQEVLMTGDRLRSYFICSDIVVRVEGTQNLMHSTQAFIWVANKVWCQLWVCQWKVHACGESVYISDTG